MDEREMIEYVEKYNKDRKNGIEHTLNAEGMNVVESLLKTSKGRESLKAGVEFDSAGKGNYTNFENVSPILKNYLGTKKLNELEKMAESMSLTDPDVQEYLEQNAMDPAFRAAVTIRTGKDSPDADNMRKFDSYMNNYLMEKTMEPPSNAQVEAVIREHGDKGIVELGKNEEKQIMMAKMMFMGQLGRYDQKEEKVKGSNAPAEKKEFDGTMADAFAHGSRTGFVLPYGKDQKQVFDALQGIDRGGAFGIDTRAAATHGLNQQTVDANGRVKSEFQEVKLKVKHFVTRGMDQLRDQYGMDVAVGGIGEKGPNGKLIMPDGTNGHLYMKVKEGDEKTCGALLVGFETEAPGKTGQLGHSHGISATAADQSAFMSGKISPGAKYGGRTVDLSGISGSQFAEVMTSFEERYRAMMKEARENSKGMEELQGLNRKLCGRHMDPTEMASVMTSMGIGKTQSIEAVNHSRAFQAGHYTDHNVHQEMVNENRVSEPKGNLNKIKREVPPKPSRWERFKAWFGVKKAVEKRDKYNAYIKEQSSQKSVKETKESMKVSSEVEQTTLKSRAAARQDRINRAERQAPGRNRDARAAQAEQRGERVRVGSEMINERRASTTKLGEKTLERAREQSRERSRSM